MHRSSRSPCGGFFAVFHVETSPTSQKSLERSSTLNRMRQQKEERREPEPNWARTDHTRPLIVWYEPYLVLLPTSAGGAVFVVSLLAGGGGWLFVGKPASIGLLPPRQVSLSSSLPSTWWVILMSTHLSTSFGLRARPHCAGSTNSTTVLEFVIRESLIKNWKVLTHDIELTLKSTYTWH